jgi:hypothetical protein
MEENTSVVPKTESAIARTASEVLEYVRERLAPTVQEERAKVEIAMARTEAITEINTAEEYREADQARRALNKAIKDGVNVLEDTKKKAHAVWKAFTTSQSDIKFDKSGEAEVARIGRLTSAYDREQERKRQEKQREAEAKAKKEAEERALKEAAELEAAGDKEAAEAVISAPVTPPPVELPSTTPDLDNTHYRDNWKVKSIDENKLPREYMTPDSVKINKIVKAMKGDTAIPGVTVWNDRKPVDRNL